MICSSRLLLPLSLICSIFASNVSASSPQYDHNKASQPERRQFGDWTVICENGNRCSAIIIAYSGTEYFWIRLLIDGGPAGVPEILVGIETRRVFRAETLETNGAWDSSQSAVILTSGAMSVYFVELYDDSGLPTIVLQLRQPLQLIDALISKSPIRIGNASNNPLSEVDGTAQALAFIDARQGRVGTVTALVSRGTAAAVQVPQPPALPTVAVAPPYSQRGYMQAGATVPRAVLDHPLARLCRQEGIDHGEGIDFLQKWEGTRHELATSARLDQRTELYGIPCADLVGRFPARYFLTDVEAGGLGP